MGGSLNDDVKASILKCIGSLLFYDFPHWLYFNNDDTNKDIKDAHVSNTRLGEFYEYETEIIYQVFYYEFMNIKHIFHRI